MASKPLKTLILMLFAGAASASAAVAPIRLDGDILGAAALARSGGTKGQDLVVLMAEDGGAGRRKAVHFQRDPAAAKLVVGATTRLPDDAVAYDVCRLGADTAETLVVITPAGLFRADGPAVVKTQTLLAYRQKGELPRVRVCFDLYDGEPQAALLPVLAGVELYRQKAGTWSRIATLPQLGELKVQGQPVRGDEARRTQRLALRLELAEARFVDFDGDGKKDICLSGDEDIACYLQKAGGAFDGGTVRRQSLAILTADEKKDTSLKATCHLVELSGDGRADLVVRKSRWGVTDMETTLYIFRQQKDGRFPAKAEQTVHRTGFFNYQEYVDLDGDGRLDLLAPVAALGWSELAGIALSKSATISFVWYRNKGDGLFATEAEPLHELNWPVDFRNFGNILGSLPLWGTRLAKGEGREIVFFPGKKAVQVGRLVGGKEGLTLETVATIPAEIGSDALAVDLNGDGVDELVLTDPRTPARARSLVYLEAP